MSTITPDSLAPGSEHITEISSIAAGGAGVARISGRVVFVPRTVPGDIVRLQIRVDKGKFLRADLAEVRQAGPWRREPPCPHWSACGGCPLQQIDPAGQSQAKHQIFLDALARIGKIDIPIPLRHIEEPLPEFGYRMRVRFQIRGDAVGFFAPGTRRLAPLGGCLLAEPPINAALSEIARLLRSEGAARRAESVEVTALGPDEGDGAGLLVHAAGSREAKEGGRAPRVSRPMRRAWEGFASATGYPLAFAGERRETADSAWAADSAWTAGYALDDLPAGCGAGGGDARALEMRVSPESFVQPNRAGNRALVRAALEAASPFEGARVLDLYCGAGNFTVPLAGRAARVAGVESSPFSLADAEANARAAGRENIRFLLREAGALKAEEAVDLLEGRPDLILLDPPRRGALETMPLVAALAPRRVVYVTCNPATFARDARALEEGGYRMASALLAPMFPNTAHVETVTSWLREEDSPLPEEEARPMEEASCS